MKKYVLLIWIKPHLDSPRNNLLANSHRNFLLVQYLLSIYCVSFFLLLFLRIGRPHKCFRSGIPLWSGFRRDMWMTFHPMVPIHNRLCLSRENITTYIYKRDNRRDITMKYETRQKITNQVLYIYNLRFWYSLHYLCTWLDTNRQANHHEVIQ